MRDPKTIKSVMNIDGLVVHYGWSPEPEDVEAESDRIEIQALRAIIDELNAPPPEYQEFATT